MGWRSDSEAAALADEDADDEELIEWWLARLSAGELLGPKNKNTK